MLGNAFDAPAEAFAALSAATRAAGVPSIHGVGAPPAIEPQARHTSPLKFRIEAGLPQIASPAGSAKLSEAALWPALEDLSMFSVRISDAGMREPHWHPEDRGDGLRSRGPGADDRPRSRRQQRHLRGGAGDAYFIPRAYPHHIEDVGGGDAHMLIFFDRATPGDIGFRTLVGAFTRDTLAATLGVAEPELPAFPFAEEDPLIVGRVNPVDPPG